MEPRKFKRAGRELGNAAAAGQICGGISWETYQWYARTERPAGNPAPKHVEVDNATGQRLYSMKDVRAWHARRPGRGNWGGIGARARKQGDVDTPNDHGVGPAEIREVTVTTLTATGPVSSATLAANHITTNDPVPADVAREHAESEIEQSTGGDPQD